MKITLHAASVVPSVTQAAPVDMTTAVKGPWFEVPVGTHPSQCGSCKAVAFWITTAAGKRMLVDCDVGGGCEPWKGVPGDGEHDGRGVSHFSQCPDADRWRKPR